MKRALQMLAVAPFLLLGAFLHVVLPHLFGRGPGWTARKGRVQPPASSLARFKPYDVDEQFAHDRIGNVPELRERPAASGRVREGSSSAEPLDW